MRFRCPNLLRTALVGAAVVAALCGATAASAEVNWSVGVNVPGVVVSEPAPVYYEPAPGYYGPAYRGEGWHHRREWEHERHEHRRDGGDRD